jgi:AP2-associated kinase
VIPYGSELGGGDLARVWEDIERVTTAAYRAPEIVDLGMRMRVGYEIDVWALGVLVYKLCYFTTPFESGGDLGILN